MTRFSFDDYHDFIGFEVSQSLLQRAFLRTYGIPLKTVIVQENFAIGTYRRSGSKSIPNMTKVALAMRGEAPSTESAATQQAVRYQLTKTNHEPDFEKQYYNPRSRNPLSADLH